MSQHAAACPYAFECKFTVLVNGISIVAACAESDSAVFHPFKTANSSNRASEGEKHDRDTEPAGQASVERRSQYVLGWIAAARKITTRQAYPYVG